MVNELVLVHIDNKPAFYARIEAIEPDVKRGWWQVKLLVLTVPLQVYTWILDDSQIAGAPYTMGGTPVRLEKVESPVVHTDKSAPEGDSRATVSAHPENARGGSGKVVSLLDRKKKE